MRLRALLFLVACSMAPPPAASAADPTVHPAESAAPPAVTTIPGSRAGDYVGQEVVVEGRVTAIHESPLATVLGFSPNFAGFTASILAGDRDKFPKDLAGRVRDRVVRVSGTVTAYRGKPEMTLRDPAQLVMAPPPGPGSLAAPAPTAAVATPDAALGDEMRRALARIESRLEALEGRLHALEQLSAEPAEPEPVR